MYTNCKTETSPGVGGLNCGPGYLCGVWFIYYRNANEEIL